MVASRRISFPNLLFFLKNPGHLLHVQIIIRKRITYRAYIFYTQTLLQLYVNVTKNIRIPLLSNVWMVERTLAKLKKVDNLKELKQKLPHQISHPSLNLILDYLDYSKKIQRTSNGIEWIFEEGVKEKNIVENLTNLLTDTKRGRIKK